MQDTANWLAWRNSSLLEATDGAASSGESSLEVSPENGPALPELRTAQNLSLPVQPELLSQQLDSLLQWHIQHGGTHNNQGPNVDLASMFPGFDIPPPPPHQSPAAAVSLSQDVTPPADTSVTTSASDTTIKALSPTSLDVSLPTPTDSIDTPASTTGAPSKRRGSTSSSQLTATDKRARNTEASKRFRANRKAREEESKRRVAELTEENDSLNSRLSALERENALLRSLITGYALSVLLRPATVGSTPSAGLTVIGLTDAAKVRHQD